MAPVWQAVGDGWPRFEVPHCHDDDPSKRWAEALDRALNFALSHVTLGLSPAALAPSTRSAGGSRLESALCLMRLLKTPERPAHGIA